MNAPLPNPSPSTPPDPSRTGAPRRWSFAVIAAVVSIIILTSFIFTRAHQTPGSHSIARATDTAIPTAVPTAIFSPSPVTVNGITVQIDGSDANAFRVEVRYHFVTPLPHPSDEYSAAVALVDEQGLIHHEVGNPLYYPPDSQGIQYVTMRFAPLVPAAPGWHNLTFEISFISFVPGEGSARLRDMARTLTPDSHPGPPVTTTPGPWTFHIQVFPRVNGFKQLSLPGQTVEGITITPLAIEWVVGTPHREDQGVHIRFAISGVSHVADTAHKSIAPYMSLSYLNHPQPDGSNSGGGDPDLTKNVGTLTLPGGTIYQPFAYFNVANNGYTLPQTFDKVPWGVGTFAEDGSAIIDAAFQEVALTPGQTLHLSISSLGLLDRSDFSSEPASYPGPWNFTITI